MSIGVGMNGDDVNERKGKDTNWVYGGNGRWREDMSGSMKKPMGGEKSIAIGENSTGVGEEKPKFNLRLFCNFTPLQSIQFFPL